MTEEEAMALTRSQALEEGCCADDSWRGRLCLYHQGFEDGLVTGIQYEQ